MRRKINRRKLKKQRKIIVISLICFMFIMIGGYAAFQTNLNIIAKGNIIEKSRVIQSWNGTDNTDFHSAYYKENIISATFLDNNDVPSNAIESWNISDDKVYGRVMAWVVQNSEDNTKYDLYIGAKDGVIANEDSSNLFSKFINIVSINFNDNFDTSNVINMQEMFYFCSHLAELNISSFNTINVTNMIGMFGGGNNLTTIDLTNFNTSKVTNMQGMYTTWNVLLDGWAYGTLETIIFGSQFDTSNVTNMSNMFSGLRKLKTLDISNFNTSKVTTMQKMFNSCESLTSLNLCSFNTSNVIDMDNMFAWTNNIQKIYVGPNWATAGADTTDMFYGSGVSEVTTGEC